MAKRQHQARSLACFFTSDGGPVGSLWRNSALWIFQPAISGTPTDVYLPGVWNGSLWTLSFEFGAYLIVLGLAMLGVLRHRRLMLAITLALWPVLTVATIPPSVNSTINYFTQPLLAPATMLLPISFAGSCIRLYRDKIPDSAVLAGGSFAAAVVVMVLPIGATVPGLTLISGGVAGPLLVYPMLWLGAHLKSIRIGRDNDYSYGVYVYAFPVTQLLAMMGVTETGWLVFAPTVIGLTLAVAVAVASWRFVEQPAMELAKAHPR